MAKRWYVVHAYSGFEHQVERTLKERIARASMQDKFGDVLVPTEEVIEMRGGQKRRSERKFFTGYVLVQHATNQESKEPTIDDERGADQGAEVMGLHQRHRGPTTADQDSGGDPATRAEGVEAATEGSVRRARCARYRWPVQRLRGVVEEVNYREEPPARGGADFRAFDARGTGDLVSQEGREAGNRNQR
jgi:transcriptional antiterminator NusG